MNVPISRYKESQTVGLGRSSEITRDELKFSKFVSRLRKRFSILFDEMLGTQLALKNIISIEDWASMKNQIYYDFLEDNFISELKYAEILQNRMQTMSFADPYIGTYLSKEWAVKNIFHLNDEEWQEMQKQIADEGKDEIIEPIADPTKIKSFKGPTNEDVEPADDEKAELIFEFFQKKIQDLEEKLNEK